MRTIILLGALLVASAVHAADLSTLDALVKRGAKLGSGDIERAKLLCVCHLPDGTARLGIFGTFPASFPVSTQVHAQCYVPTYDELTGDVIVQQACSVLSGFFEVVK
jgi:hypothetical protein